MLKCLIFWLCSIHTTESCSTHCVALLFTKSVTLFSFKLLEQYQIVISFSNGCSHATRVFGNRCATLKIFRHNMFFVLSKQHTRTMKAISADLRIWIYYSWWQLCATSASKLSEPRIHSRQQILKICSAIMGLQ